MTCVLTTSESLAFNTIHTGTDVAVVERFQDRQAALSAIGR